MKTMRAEAQTFLHAAFGLWVGIYAFRTFVTTAVWNLSDALPLWAKGALAIGVHLAGVLACLLPFLRRPQAHFFVACALAIVGVVRQAFLGSDVVGSAAALLGWILWLWWLLAFAHYALRAGWQRLLAPAFAAAFAFQLGMQSAWHGLDLTMVRGPLAILCAFALHATFALSGWLQAAEPAEGTRVPGTALLVVIGPAMFLELTLLGNVGRFGFISGLSLLPSVLMLQAALALGLLLTRYADRRGFFLAALLILVVSAFGTPLLNGRGAWLLLMGQAALIPVFAGAATRHLLRLRAAYALGTALMFAFVFVFYNQYEAPPLWLLAALLMALALPAGRSATVSAHYARVIGAAVVLALIGLVHPLGEPDARTVRRVLTYNIHQGYDAFGVPAIQQIAHEIARIDADAMVLQEVGRGWDLLGGVDLIAYLRYRFPQYAVDYIPFNGQLTGLAFLSRVPLSNGRRARVFDAPANAFRYGYDAWPIPIGRSTTTLVGVHLSAGLEGNGGDARVDQMNQLLRAFERENSVILAGDFNTQPHEAPVQNVLRAGYRDVVAEGGLGMVRTWPADRPFERDDYVFVRGNVKPTRVAVLQTLASDHFPIIVEFK